jgi:hypothetical protein
MMGIQINGFGRARDHAFVLFVPQYLPHLTNVRPVVGK